MRKISRDLASYMLGDSIKQPCEVEYMTIGGEEIGLMKFKILSRNRGVVYRQFYEDSYYMVEHEAAKALENKSE